METSNQQATTTSDADDKQRAEYWNRYYKLVDGEQKAYETYDKYLIALSSGGIALSLQILKLYALKGCARNCILVGSGAFGLSLVVILVSFLLSAKAWRKEIEILNTPNEDLGQRHIICIQHLNCFATVAFVLGVICIIATVAIHT